MIIVDIWSSTVNLTCLSGHPTYGEYPGYLIAVPGFLYFKNACLFQFYLYFSVPDCHLAQRQSDILPGVRISTSGKKTTLLLRWFITTYEATISCGFAGRASWAAEAIEQEQAAGEPLFLMSPLAESIPPR